jgi:hypothetical protein
MVGGSKWLFRCDCGNEKIAQRSHVTRGLTSSCGCLWREMYTTHDMSRTPLYRRWMAMRRRCTNPNFKQFKDYGGRGISIAEEWMDFPTFAAWSLANGYSENLELDRIDPDGNYEPSNCRWITHFENMQNMRRTTWLVVRGERMSISEASIKFGLTKSCIRWRLRRGDSHEEAVRPLSTEWVL